MAGVKGFQRLRTTPYTTPTKKVIPVSTYIPASGSLVLWRWNGTDTSQFPSFKNNEAGSATSEVLSVSTATGVGPRLRYAVTVDGPPYFTLLTPSDMPTLPSRYLVRYRIAFITYDPSQNVVAGFFSHNNASAIWGFGAGVTQDGIGIAFAAEGDLTSSGLLPFITRSTSGYILQPNVSAGAVNCGTWYESEVIISEAALSTPTWPMIGTQSRGLGNTISSSGVDAETLLGSTPDSGWDARADLTSLGFFYMNSTFTGDYVVEFAELEVLKHPMDW